MILSGAVLFALPLQTGVRKERKTLKKPEFPTIRGFLQYRVKKEKNGREA